MKHTLQLIEVMKIIDNKQSAGVMDIIPLIQNTQDKIFSNYEIFDENYRSVLNSKILAHYAFHEIGQETMPLFLFTLNRKMGEIMPYYNQLYTNALAIENIDTTIDSDYYEEYTQKGDKTGKITGDNVSRETYTKNSTGDNSSTVTMNGTKTDKIDDRSNGGDTLSNNTDIDVKTTTDNNVNVHAVDEGTKQSTDWNYFNDTPQGNINGVNELSYLTNLTKLDNDGSDSRTTDTTTSGGVTETHTDKNISSSVGSNYNYRNANNEYKDNSTTETSGNTSGKEDSETNRTSGDTRDENWNDTMEYVRHIYGLHNTNDILNELLKIRDSLVNIDMLVIDALKTCFFGLW